MTTVTDDSRLSENREEVLMVSYVSVISSAIDVIVQCPGLEDKASPARLLIISFTTAKIVLKVKLHSLYRPGTEES
jgi:hypothetical protein